MFLLKSKPMTRFLILSVLFLLVFAITGNGQNIRRGYKLLEKTDYEKAGVLFSEAIEENPKNPAALLGLMLILADDSSSSFDLISAWKNGSAITSLLEQFTTEDLEFVGEYFYNTEERHINRPVKKKIEYAVETVEAKLIRHIREENDLELVYSVLEAFPDFKYYENVIHIRNQLEFRKYEKQNTLDGYLEFIRKFPEAAQIEKAIRYRNRFAFEMASTLNTHDSYSGFLNKYPEAAEATQAIKRLHSVDFESAKKAGSIQALDEFMARYPDALENYEAKQIQKQLLFEYARKIQTLEAYNEFIRKYPEGQQYIDIFNLKSLDNGMRFLSSHPVNSDNIVWSRSFEAEEIDEISSCLAIDTLNNYIIGGIVFRIDTGYTDAWIIKVNPEGKMLWNKYVGEAFNDEIYQLIVNSQNEILGSGYTWTGMDSSSRESWIFKLGSDGTKLWSRKLGRMHISSLSTTSNGTIFAGGFLTNDSLQDLFSVVVLNDQGKRLWARTYTGKGHIIHSGELKNGNMILAGTDWYAMIDQKGYILSEHLFNETDSIVACRIDGNNIRFLAIRDSVKIVIYTTDDGNKLLPALVLEMPEVQCRISSIAQVDNQFILLATYNDHQVINRIDIRTAKILSSTRLPDGITFNTLTVDREKNLLIQACNGEIILLKNNGITF